MCIFFDGQSKPWSLWVDWQIILYNLRLITFSSTLRCDQISNDEILLSTDPSQKQEVNRKAFAKFDKDHSGSRTATAAAESDPTVRYNGKVTLSTCQQYMNSNDRFIIQS